MGQLCKAPVTIKQIEDGTSKTLLVGEYTTTTQPAGIPPISRSAFWASTVFGNNLSSVTLPAGTSTSDPCRTNPLGCNASATSITLDADYNRCATISPVVSFPQPCYRTFASVHGGGYINFVLCDGSVKGFANTTDIRILAAMATIQGGESIQVP
jgi:prepilin-type processing-associated H-X9-DG protein